MSNPSFSDGLVKIGKSDRDPDDYRKHELSSSGVPEPFKVEYWAYVDNHHDLEKKVHHHFSQYRPNKNREFFTTSIPIAIDAIRELSKSGILKEKVSFKSPEEIEKLRKEREKREDERVRTEKLERQRRLAGRKKEEVQKIRGRLMNIYNGKRNEFMAKDKSNEGYIIAFGFLGFLGMFLFGTKILGEEFQNLEVTMVIIIVTSVVVLGGLFLNKDINPEKDKEMEERFRKYIPIIEEKVRNIEKGIANDPQWESSLSNYQKRAEATLKNILDKEAAKLLAK